MSNSVVSKVGYTMLFKIDNKVVSVLFSQQYCSNLTGLWLYICGIQDLDPTDLTKSVSNSSGTRVNTQKGSEIARPLRSKII